MPEETVAEPPRTLEDLRALALSIGRDQAGFSLGSKAHEVFAKLVEAPEQSAVRSISELAGQFGINPSTLTRLAKRLGFEGFGDFQAVFRKAIANDQQYFYSRQAGRLLATRSVDNSEIEAFESLARETAANVDGFLGQLDGASLKGATKLLASARRVRIHGVRQFHSLASFLTYCLGMVRSDVALLDAPRLGLAEALSQLEKGDVVVVASCAPYTRSVAEVARIAAANGQRVIAITDSRASPLVPPAEHAFFIPHASSFYSNSMGAYVAFCEALLNLVARELGDKALNSLAARERLIAEMNIEVG
jgi:DNA-binding MurR/RpiR family transcriptional regulator